MKHLEAKTSTGKTYYKEVTSTVLKAAKEKLLILSRKDLIMKFYLKMNM